MRRGLTTAREFFGERAQNAEAQRRSDMARALNEIPFLRGRMISVSLTGGLDKAVDHGLGVPATFIVARTNYANGLPANIVESDPSLQAELDPARQLYVLADINCIVDLWFYPRASKVIDTTTGQSP